MYNIKFLRNLSVASLLTLALASPVYAADDADRVKSSEKAGFGVEEIANSPRFLYDPSGKRDPFKPFDLAPQIDLTGREDLERYPIDQLRLTAVMRAGEEPTALIVNRAGHGYTVRKGTKVGINGGEIIEILEDKLLILETSGDFTGETSTRTVELLLRR